MDTEVVTKKLTEFYYKKPSLIELFYVEKKKGKLILSFIQERTNYESILDPDDESQIIYTIQSKKESLRNLFFSPKR